MAVGLQSVFVNKILGFFFTSVNRVSLYDGTNVVETYTDSSLPGSTSQHTMKGSDLGWDLTADNGCTVTNTNKVYYKPNSESASYSVSSFVITNNPSGQVTLTIYFIGDFADTYTVPTNYQIKIYPYEANANKGIKVSLTVSSS